MIATQICAYRVLRRPVKRINPQVPFYTTEEQFDLPAELIALGDQQCRQKKIIRQERQMAVIYPIIKTNSPKRLGIIGFRFRAVHVDGLIGEQVHGFIDESRGDSSRLKIQLGSDDENIAVPTKSVEPGIIQIDKVQDVEGTRLQREVVEDSDIVSFSICHMDKRRYRSYQIEKRMEPDGAFTLAELGPGKKRETRVDRDGIERKDCLFELQARRNSPARVLH